MSEEIVEERNNFNTFSQPANNKVTGILKSLLAVGCNIIVLSSGLVNSRTGKIYKRKEEKYCGVSVIYCAILDIPLLNTLSSILYMYSEILRLHRMNKIDHIIFYNYKPEVAWPAYLAKCFLKIPITLEYEDGYSHVTELSLIKRFLFEKTEKIVSKKVDFAILVTSLMASQISIPNVIIRGVVNTALYEDCRRYNKKKNEKFTILYSGGLDEARGINVLLSAIPKLEFDCKVIVTGKGKLNFDDERVDFRGFVSYQEVKELMMQSDVLVQCQLEKHDFGSVSFPSKLFEYITTGNYIISSNVSDVKVFAGDCIDYYENDDSKQLALAIERAYKNWKNNLIEISRVNSLCEKNLPENIGKKIIQMWSDEEDNN